MSKFCNKECKEVGPICDFCRLYNFNSDISGVYVGQGYCTFEDKRREPEDGCPYFICMNYKVTPEALKREEAITDAYVRELDRKDAAKKRNKKSDKRSKAI